MELLTLIKDLEYISQTHSKNLKDMKTKEHYLASELDGEPSGWAAFFVDGKWVEKTPEIEERPARGGRKKK